MSRAIAITEDASLLSPPRALEAQARAYIVARGSVYTAEDIRLIVGYYWRYSVPANIDPLLVIAQCIHETSEIDLSTGRWRPLSSWWAQRPRRNPAGLGVTGQTLRNPPPDRKGWVEDTRSQPPIWRAGLVFESWDVGSQAHIGRVLAYAVPVGAETTEQRRLIDFALSVRPLPRRMRGTAPTLKPLGARHNPTGHGWASPGDRYGAKIAAIAQAIREV